MPQTAYKFAAQVGTAGKLEVTVPVPAGTSVEVLVLMQPADEFADLVDATRTSLDFWDNPQDDADWIMPSQGEIVLVPIPFTDVSSMRRRPVIVISSDVYNSATADMVVVGMTSNLTPTPYSFVLTQAELVAGTLNHTIASRPVPIVSGSAHGSLPSASALGSAAGLSSCDRFARTSFRRSWASTSPFPASVTSLADALPASERILKN